MRRNRIHDEAGRSWRNAAGAWSIVLLAAVLLAWAVIDFVFAGTDRVVRWVDAPSAAEAVAPAGTVEAIDFHRLMPDATDDLGRVVRVDGRVLAVDAGSGFWLRDLRDHVVYVAADERDRPLPAPDDLVAVRGVVTIFSPDARRRPLAEAARLLPADALVVKAVKIVPVRDGIRRREP